MKSKIIRACEMVTIPKRLLVDRGLSLDAKGAAGALLTFNDCDYSIEELAKLVGVSEAELMACLDELAACGYARWKDGVYMLLDE